jgi:hypothetical protein
MPTVDRDTKRNLRGAILKLVYQKRERQESRFRSQTLCAALDQLSYEVHLDLVHEMLQDLSDSGYLTYTSNRGSREWQRKGELVLSDIQLTPAGRNLVEGIETDPAIDI